MTPLKCLYVMFQCCKEDAYDNKSNDNEIHVNGNGFFEDSATEATTTKKLSSVDLDYYAMYDDLLKEKNPNCRNCSQAEIEAERNNTDNGNGIDYGDYGNYGNYGGDGGDGVDGNGDGDL
jgi:ribosomal protein S27AE